MVVVVVADAAGCGVGGGGGLFGGLVRGMGFSNFNMSGSAGNGGAGDAGRTVVPGAAAAVVRMVLVEGNWATVALADVGWDRFFEERPPPPGGKDSGKDMGIDIGIGIGIGI